MQRLVLFCFLLILLLSNLCRAKSIDSTLYWNVFWKETDLSPSETAAKGWIWVRAGRIEDVGYGEPPPDLFYSEDISKLDMKGIYAEPGHVNAHTSLLRQGIEVPKEVDPWKISTRLTPEEISTALLKGQAIHLSQGITSIQDETLDAGVMAIMGRLEKLGLLKIRIWTRSYGLHKKSRSWMQSIAGTFSDFEPEKKLHYYGEQYFDSEKLTDNEIRDIYIFAGRVGIAFDINNAKEALRIARIRKELLAFRHTSIVDVIEGDFDLDPSQEKMIEESGAYWAQDLSDPSVFSPGVGKVLGKIKKGYDADLVFYKIQGSNETIEQTLIRGETVFDRSEAHPPISETLQNPQYSSHKELPFGWTLVPLAGYDPAIGFLTGVSYFTYPYSDTGNSFSSRAVIAPFSLRGLVDLDWTQARGLGLISPRISTRMSTLSGRYYGFGDSTSVDNPIITQPSRFDLIPALIYRFHPRMEVQFSGILTSFYEGQADAIAAASQQSEGPFNGIYSAARLEFTWDERDNPYSTRVGGKRVAWTESWFFQAGAPQFAQRVGLSLSQFFPVSAPDWIIATRLDGSAVIGTRSYLTAVSLGGQSILRGYLGNRFRGDQAVSTAVELRFPLWKILSGTFFTEVGRVWSAQDPLPQATFLGLHPSAGVGLRVGIPPGYLIKMRIDYGVGLDQSGFYLTFNEAF